MGPRRASIDLGGLWLDESSRHVKGDASTSALCAPLSHLRRMDRQISA